MLGRPCGRHTVIVVNSPSVYQVVCLYQIVNSAYPCNPLDFSSHYDYRIKKVAQQIKLLSIDKNNILAPIIKTQKHLCVFLHAFGRIFCGPPRKTNYCIIYIFHLSFFLLSFNKSSLTLPFHRALRHGEQAGLAASLSRLCRVEPYPVAPRDTVCGAEGWSNGRRGYAHVVLEHLDSIRRATAYLDAVPLGA